LTEATARSVPRQKTTTQPGAGERVRAKKPTAKKPEAASKATAAKAAQPTLVELIRRHLADQSEPRSAAEIATALGEAHPDRNIKTTVVRTTVEGLVAKSHAQRTKQGSSVYYTTTNTPEPATPATAPAEDQSDIN
jgi:hypothetical protein